MTREFQVKNINRRDILNLSYVLIFTLLTGYGSRNKIELWDIIPEKDLIGKITEMISSQRKLIYPQDINLMASIVYHSVRYFNGSPESALSSTQNIVRAPYPSASNCSQDAVACVYGRKIEYIESLMHQSSPSPALNFLSVLAHEGYHVFPKIKGYLIKHQVENYGFMGTYHSKIHQGFGGVSRYEGRYKNPLYLHYSFNILEEFAARWGSFRYVEYLNNMGLATEEVEKYVKTPDLYYLGFRIPLHDMRNPLWQKFWGNNFSPTTTDLLHKNSDRYAFLLGLGDRVSNLNGTAGDLDEPDIGGLGLLAINTFLLKRTEDKVDYLKILEENGLNQYQEAFRAISQ